MTFSGEFDLTTGVDMTALLNPHGRLVVSEDPSTASGKLTVTFTNTTDQAVSKVLNYTLYADSYLSVVSVPEPGTWALMMLGMAGLAMASRQRLKGSDLDS